MHPHVWRFSTFCATGRVRRYMGDAGLSAGVYLKQLMKREAGWQDQRDG
jgi:hypothetical protein